MTTSSIFVTHNAEIAHRLILLPGKCERIHGHSLQITLTIFGEIDGNGILAGLDYGTVKKLFRQYIDENYDHHLHLNESDQWAKPIETVAAYEAATGEVTLPGLVTHPGDPTTENISKWICEWAWEQLGNHVDGIRVTISETNTNGAGFELP